MELPKINYTFKAKVAAIIDGDTCDVELDLGFDVVKRERLRLARINAPEMKGPDAEKAGAVKSYLERTILNRDVVIMTKRTDIYGRYIAELYFSKNGLDKNISDVLLEKKFVEQYPKKET